MPRLDFEEICYFVVFLYNVVCKTLQEKAQRLVFGKDGYIGIVYLSMFYTQYVLYNRNNFYTILKFFFDSLTRTDITETKSWHCKFAIMAARVASSSSK